MGGPSRSNALQSRKSSNLSTGATKLQGTSPNKQPGSCFLRSEPPRSRCAIGESRWASRPHRQAHRSGAPSSTQARRDRSCLPSRHPRSVSVARRVSAGWSSPRWFAGSPRRQACWLLPNRGFKLTRRALCLLGGPAFGQDAAMRRPCNSPAAQLKPDVRRHVDRP